MQTSGMNSSLQYPCQDTVVVNDCIHKAYAQAELFTSLGFEVTKPRSYDGGKNYEFTASREEV